MSLKGIDKLKSICGLCIHEIAHRYHIAMLQNATMLRKRNNIQIFMKLIELHMNELAVRLRLIKTNNAGILPIIWALIYCILFRFFHLKLENILQ